VRPGRGVRAAAGALLLAATGCTGAQNMNVLDPRGPQAARIAEWFWFSFALAALIFVAYCVILGVSIWKARERERTGRENPRAPQHARHLVLWGGVVVPAVVLLGLLVYSLVVDRALATLAHPTDPDVLTVEVTGHQFWWEVRYRDQGRPYREFTTANEIHIPVGRPVRFHLISRDVIHSFWVPNLHGKTDLIPRRPNTLIMQADSAGVYHGQCAEFCGVQHAKMRFLVIAQPEEEFLAWWDRQVQPAAPPADSLLMAGRDAFMGEGCALCHAVRGTEAMGRVGPDLTHFGSRGTLGAGIAPNTRGHLAGWIIDPQGMKPGNFMPPMKMDGERLQALVAYLHSLR
jgi:cytochrome c oxidase subunit II